MRHYLLATIRPVAAAAATLGLMGLGCVGPHAGDDFADLPDDIIKVVAFLDTNPWLSFDPSLMAPDGLKVKALYLLSSRTQKGVFAAGTIEVLLYSVRSPGTGPAALEALIQKWALGPAEALPYRVKKIAPLGRSYHLRLPWRDIDIAGREVALVIRYRNRAGDITATRRPTFLKVPPRQPPAPTVPPSPARR